MQVLVPFTRPWAIEPFFAALSASDIPRDRLILILDAPGCEGAEASAKAAGFTRIVAHATNNPAPPDGSLVVRERRERHLAMRRASQALVEDGPLLVLEDDTLVPPDVYRRLSAIGPNATAVQVSRHGPMRAAGVWRMDEGFARTLVGSGIEPIDACGHFCLLTTGAAYKGCSCEPGPPPMDAIDRAHTYRIGREFGGIVVDWDCGCGHLMPDQTVLMPPATDIAWVDEGGSTGWANAKTMEVGGMPNRRYLTKERIVLGGFILCGPNDDVSMSQALDWLRQGATGLDDLKRETVAEILAEARPYPPGPSETKPTGPSEFKCPLCEYTNANLGRVKMHAWGKHRQRIVP